MVRKILGLAVVGLSVCFASQAKSAVIKIDFGRHDGSNGQVTSSPDVNGNYWNNLSPSTAATSSAVPLNTSFSNLVTTTNAPTTVGITVTSGVTNTGTLGNWECNGYNNGGLINPSAALLGDFAIPTATRDYWFCQATAQTLNIVGLNPTLTYNFRLFGTRITTSVRSTKWTLTGANSGTGGVQTSGPDIGAGPNQTGGGSADNGSGTVDGNDKTIVPINGIQPTAGGIITLKLESTAGAFAYLGIMEITDIPAPEPMSLTAAAGAGLLMLARRRASR
ncbi:MAG: hypothetical protein QM770_22175 [Tepidisphaeraceae bacterium]